MTNLIIANVETLSHEMTTATVTAFLQTIISLGGGMAPWPLPLWIRQSLIVTLVISCAVSEIGRLIGWKLRIFPTRHSAPPLPVCNFAVKLTVRNPQSWGYSAVKDWKLHDPNFNRLWLIHPWDGQTALRIITKIKNRTRISSNAEAFAKCQSNRTKLSVLPTSSSPTSNISISWKPFKPVTCRTGLRDVT